jgi:hypothetical protein
MEREGKTPPPTYVSYLFCRDGGVRKSKRRRVGEREGERIFDEKRYPGRLDHTTVTCFTVQREYPNFNA